MSRDMIEFADKKSLFVGGSGVEERADGETREPVEHPDKSAINYKG